MDEGWPGAVRCLWMMASDNGVWSGMWRMAISCIDWAQHLALVTPFFLALDSSFPHAKAIKHKKCLLHRTGGKTKEERHFPLTKRSERRQMMSGK